VLVNTIGAFCPGGALCTAPETLRLMLDVILGPALWLSRAFAPHMQQQGSISSSAARDPGERGRAATARHPRQPGHLPGGRDGARGRAGGDRRPDRLPGQRRRSAGERGDPAGGRRPSRTRRTYRAGRTEASSRMACACPWSVTLTQPRNHRDPVTASHLAGGKPGPIAKARTAARDVLRDPREIP
jgi:hypothetical protein